MAGLGSARQGTAWPGEAWLNYLCTGSNLCKGLPMTRKARTEQTEEHGTAKEGRKVMEIWNRDLQSKDDIPDSDDFEDQTTRLPEWRALYDDALHWDYDVIYPHEYIEGILGVSRSAEGPTYYGRVTRAIRELMRDRRHVVNVSGLGYKLIRPNEAIGPRADQLVEKADRAMGRCVENLVTVDAEQLTPKEQGVWRFKIDRTMYAKSITEQTKVDLIARARDAPKLILSPAREKEETP